MATSPNNPSVHTGGAHKRLYAYADTTPAKRQRQEPPRPADLLNGWHAALRNLPIQAQTQAQVEDFLGCVAGGQAFPHERGSEQLVFNELIRCEAFDLFVDVFNAYQRIPRPDTGAPALSRLVLQMPLNWAPLAMDQMVDAFTKVAVQRLVVFPPPSTAQSYYHVPIAVQDCIVALLEPDTTALVELAIHGAMHEPTGIADAFATSKLESIEFGWMDDEAPPDHGDMAGYETLMEGLDACATLERIDIQHPSMFALHPILAQFPPHRPPLTSIGFVLNDLHPVARVRTDEELQIRAFMGEVRDVETITTVKGLAHVVDGESLAAAFIEPLSGHPSLTTLEIEGQAELPTNVASLEVLPRLVDMGTSCPVLTHVKFAQAPLPFDAGDSMRAYVEAGGDLQMPEASQALKTAMANSAIQSLTLNGVPQSTGVLNALAEALVGNTHLRHLDLAHCHLDLPAILLLMQVLERNTTLESLVLPEQHDNYYFTASDGLVYGLRRKGSNRGGNTMGGFAIQFPQNATLEQRTRASVAFSEWENEANQLFDAVRARNHRFRHAMNTASIAHAPLG